LWASTVEFETGFTPILFLSFKAAPLFLNDTLHTLTSPGPCQNGLLPVDQLTSATSADIPMTWPSLMSLMIYGSLFECITQLYIRIYYVANYICFYAAFVAQRSYMWIRLNETSVIATQRHNTLFSILSSFEGERGVWWKILNPGRSMVSHFGDLYTWRWLSAKPYCLAAYTSLQSAQQLSRRQPSYKEDTVGSEIGFTPNTLWFYFWPSFSVTLVLLWLAEF
jgi:hypothetical protein